MLRKIYETFPSITEENACTNCLTSDTRHQIYMLANLPTDDLLFLSDVLKTYNIDQILCKNFDLVFERKVVFNEHLIVEPVVPMTKKRIAANNLYLNIKLNDVNKILKIQAKIST